MVSLDDDEPIDTEDPEAWQSAATAFVARLPARGLTREQVAYGLSVLSDSGHVVHPRIHDHVCQGYADRLRACEQAADELVRQLHGGKQ